MSTEPRPSRTAAWLFLLCLAALTAFLAFRLPQVTISSSVLDLLPGRALENVPGDIEQGFAARLDRELVFLIRAPYTRDRAVRLLHRRLSDDPLVASVTGLIPRERQEEIGRFLFEYRTALIDVTTRQRLASGPQEYADFVMSQLMTAFAGISAEELREDPLLLMRSLLQEAGRSELSVEDEFLAVHHGQDLWYLLTAQSRESAHAARPAAELTAHIEDYLGELAATCPDAEVLRRGALFYSAAASAGAEHDLRILGTSGAVLVLVLVLAVFGSVRPLLLSACSLFSGLICGTAALVACYGVLHIVTLVMAVSIIGIASDYTIYYLTRRLVHGGGEDAVTSLRRVLPELLLALGTTLLAYALMLLVPFGGLRQLALFALCGLGGAAAFVICIEPWCTGRMRTRTPPGRMLAEGWLRAWQGRAWLRWGLPLLCAAVAAGGLWQLRFDDDVHALQDPPPQLREQDRRMADILTQGSDQTFFLLFAFSDEELLKLHEELTELLHEARSRGQLSGYRSLPLNSLRTQDLNYRLLSDAAQTMTEIFRQNGIDMDYIVIERKMLHAEEFFRQAGDLGYSLMFLRSGAYSALALPVSGVSSAAAMQDIAAECANTYYVDRAGAYSELFAVYRVRLLWLVGAALALLCLCFMLRLGLRRGLLASAPSIIAMALAAAVPPLSGQALNLFAVLALVLVIGIGINYTIFLAGAAGEAPTAFLANALAMATTLLTLGLLVFSSTHAISSFGQVLAAGILTTFLLSPLAAAPAAASAAEAPAGETAAPSAPAAGSDAGSAPASGPAAPPGMPPAAPQAERGGGAHAGLRGGLQERTEAAPGGGQMQPAAAATAPAGRASGPPPAHPDAIAPDGPPPPDGTWALPGVTSPVMPQTTAPTAGGAYTVRALSVQYGDLPQVPPRTAAGAATPQGAAARWAGAPSGGTWAGAASAPPAAAPGSGAWAGGVPAAAASAAAGGGDGMAAGPGASAAQRDGRDKEKRT